MSALELARLADALDTRIEWFVEDVPPAILSRRNARQPGAPSPRIDAVTERITRAVEFVVDHDERLRLATPPTQPVPTTVAEAEALAGTARRLMSIDASGPCTDLAAKVETCGLLVFSFPLGTESADAASVLLRTGGVALLNGTLHVGRRRFALAHELGHYLVADDYTVDWRVAEHQDTEQREYLLDRFARAVLLPEDSLRVEWERYATGDAGDPRTAAVRIASRYRVDMATLARRLTELGIMDRDEAARVRSVRTTQADIVELDLVVAHELEPPTLPREYQRAILRLYRNETVTRERALDLLFDTWSEDMLP